MLGTVLTDQSGKPISATSSYFPSEEVKNLTAKIQQDFVVANDNQNRPFAEFNDLSVIARQDADQRAFNSYIPSAEPNTEQSWRHRGTRPTTRNKIISIAAHATTVLLYPNVFAQNSGDEEDKVAARTMRDIIESLLRNSDYENKMLYTVISMLVNPATYLEAQFGYALQTIKEKDERGEISTKEVIDEIYSGFQTHIIPLDEMFIANPYEFDVQRQRYVARRKVIEYDEAEALYGSHNNFEYVRPGVNVFFSKDNNTFYEDYSEDLTTLVEEVTYKNRQEDTEVTFVNGVYLGTDDVNANLIRHRDSLNRPKYNFAKSGFEPIDERRFHYYKSAAFKLINDQNLMDRMWQMTMDKAFLDLFPPVGVFGDENISSSVVFPGRVTSFGKNTRMEAIQNGNINAGFNAIQAAQQSMNESSQDETRQGVTTQGGKTAFEIAQTQKNAQIQMGIFGKQLSSLVKDFGDLMVDIILNHMTVPELEQTQGDDMRLKFKVFMLDDQRDRGKKVTKKIIMTDEFFGREMTEQQIRIDEEKLLREEGGIDGETRITKVNVPVFRQLKFKVFIDADEFPAKNEALEKALKMEAYDRMITNPFADQEAVSRDYLFDVFTKGESDKYMKKGQQIQPEVQTEGGSELVEQLTGSGSLKDLIQR